MITIFLICLVQKLGILDFFVLNVSDEQLSSYSDYYFNKLDQDEQKMYVKIDESIRGNEEKVFLGAHESGDITDKVTKVITAYFYDNPEIYYISNEYVISINDFKTFKFVTVKLSYITNDDAEIYVRNKQLEAAINNILNENIKDEMTDFEKEVAIHDALVKKVAYYEYEEIDKIPAIKHTAYGALVENEAVCDGYSKAFKILLDRVGINNAIISGEAKNVAHAWNIVELDDEYYHVDVTSDKLENGADRYAIHTYFNVTDKEIFKTHTIHEQFKHPSIDATGYDYYEHNGYFVDYEDYLDDKLRGIVSEQKYSDILEIKVDKNYSARKIIDTLYEINFNNWRSTGKTSVSYTTIDDVYVFIK